MYSRLGAAERDTMHKLLRDTRTYARCVLYDAMGNGKLLEYATRENSGLLLLRPHFIASLEVGLYWLLSETSDHGHLILSAIKAEDDRLVEKEIFRCDRYMELPEPNARVFIGVTDLDSSRLNPIPDPVWTAIEEWAFSSPASA